LARPVFRSTVLYPVYMTSMAGVTPMPEFIGKSPITLLEWFRHPSGVTR
jgi:hypothetical protein